MVDCLVTGVSNAGKTCFVINFAEYMGLKELKLFVKQQAGYTAVRSYTTNEARDQLVSLQENYTKEVQSVKLEIPVGKVFKELELVDSCGLSDGIHPEETVRIAMARTIRLIRESKIVFHIIDLTTIQPEGEIILPVDKMIMEYAGREKEYIILANKIDLKYAQEKLPFLKKCTNNYRVLPISALYQKGFKEVRRLVLNYV